MDRHMACTQCYTVNFCKTCLIRGKNAVDPNTPRVWILLCDFLYALHAAINQSISTPTIHLYSLLLNC